MAAFNQCLLVLHHTGPGDSGRAGEVLLLEKLSSQGSRLTPQNVIIR